MPETSHLQDLDAVYKSLREIPLSVTAKIISKKVNLSVWHTEDLLARLIKDGYIQKTEDDLQTEWYSIVSNNIDTQGYQSRYEEEKFIKETTKNKLWFDTENARVQFEDYPITKKKSSAALYISLGLLLLKLIEWIVSLK